MPQALWTVSLMVLVTGCGAPDAEAVATWSVAPGQALDVDTTAFTALVTRLGCNSGVTGTVNDPDIELADDAVLLTFTVSPGEPEAATCPSNDEVAYEVQLPEALGERALVDGACSSTRAGDTAPCQPDGVRFAP